MNRKDSLVHCVKEISPDAFVEECFLANRPCFIPGGATTWPAVDRWSDDEYLREVAGHQHVAQTESTREDNAYNHQSPIIPVRLREFLDRYTSENRYYINDSDVPSILVQDIGSLPIFDGFNRLERYHKRMGWFFGAGDQLAPLHYDDEENIYVLLAGEKEFTLFDTSSFDDMYPHDTLYLPDFSQTTLCDAGEAFPGLCEAPCQTVHMRAGDVLYVPGYWWHEVKSTGRNVALSWVRTDRSSQRMALCKLIRAGVMPINNDVAEACLNKLETPHSADADTMVNSLNSLSIPADVLPALAVTTRVFEDALLQGEEAQVHSLFYGLSDGLSGKLRDWEQTFSYPVLYLLQNFFRIGLEIFKDHGLEKQ